MTLQEKQDRMIRDINAMGDAFDQYAYLLVKAQQLPVMPEEQRTDQVLVAGCQSKVWAYVWTQEGRVRFQADSDAVLIRGALQLLQELLDGEPAQEVSALSVVLFQETELGATFTSDRSTGLRSILRQIQSGGTEPEGDAKKGHRSV